jgi:putative metallohydrolase (TIGR04338 family)
MVNTVAVRQSIRDSQRQKVYDAEDLVFHKSLPPEYETVAECQEFVDHVTASDVWTKVLGVRTWAPVKVRDGRGRRRAGARSEDDELLLPRWSRSRWVILHELAHIANDYIHNFDLDEDTGDLEIEYTTAPHGPEYAGIYLYLVRGFLFVADHDRLEAAFREGKVKIIPVEAPYPELPSMVVTGIDSQDGHCLQCRRELSIVGRRHKFCSDVCSWTYHNHLRHLRGDEDRQKVCVVCGVEFISKRSDAKTCSPRCRQRLRRRNKTS